MILYSFTDRPHLRACRTSGIEHGVIPYTVLPKDRGKTLKLINWDTYQWLTNVPDFIDMTSSAGPKKTAVLQGRKQEFRLKLDIPYYGRNRLRSWDDFARKWEIPLRWQIWLDLAGRPQDWWIYAGVIPAKWIIEVARNPTAPDTTFDKVVERPELAVNMDHSGIGQGTKWDPDNSSGTHKW